MWKAPQVKEIFSQLKQRSAGINQPMEPYVKQIINMC